MVSTDSSKLIIVNAVKSCAFNIYTRQEILNLSAKRITSCHSFDRLLSPVVGGVYDLALGLSTDFGVCATCGQSGPRCPGHIGHIDLPFHVYNPIVLAGLERLINLMCFFCNSWRFGEFEAESLLDVVEEADGSFVFEKFIPEDNSEGLGEFQKSLLKKVLTKSTNRLRCQSCKCYNPTVRSNNKYALVLKPILAKDKKKNKEILGNEKIPDILKLTVSKEIAPFEVRSFLKKFCEKNLETVQIAIGFLSSKEDPKLLDFDKKQVEEKLLEPFFTDTVVVTPAKHRPLNVVGNRTMENEQSIIYMYILKIVDQYEKIAAETDVDKETKRKKLAEFRENNWQKLQMEYSKLYNSSINSEDTSSGLKQKLEKKEGIIRSNLMGKRVNFTARSVASPDLWIETTEVGIPVSFAKKLTIPENVTDFNLKKLKKYIINGAFVYPGANFVENEAGTMIDLKTRSSEERMVIANSLVLNKVIGSQTIESNMARKKVHRHLEDGDAVLVNRQPTLHKASMMGHKVKVMKNDHEVIRLHYANCNSYNADFDGDEINVHVPQSHLARIECRTIAQNHLQYLSPKNGEPLRGLVQDHVCAAVLLTKRDTFFNQEEYQQYVYLTLSVDELEENVPTSIVAPCILKPRKLWSGKQIISTILDHISVDKEKLNLDSKSQTPSFCWNKDMDYKYTSIVTIRKNRWLTGVCDKAQIGAKKFGLISTVSELYGTAASDRLLTKIGKLATSYIQNRGLTAGTSDLVLLEDYDDYRQKATKKIEKESVQEAAKFAGVKGQEFSKNEILSIIKTKLQKSLGEKGLDNVMRNYLNPIISELSSATFPHGLKRDFSKNNFSLMVLTGGKGSRVNVAQISSQLGQQELEGKRVPRSVAGKTLPCFKAFEMTAEAGGFIADRFLTGIDSKMFYFHCMAGREGLCDTAVKTCRSGYLQRSIVKSLENVSVSYDQTVRKSNGNILQFNYGEDGLDPTKTAFLKNFKFVKMNLEAYMQNIKDEDASYLDFEKAPKYYKNKKSKTTPILSVMNPLKNWACVSENFMEAFLKYERSFKKEPKDLKKQFRMVMFFKFLFSLVEPGENVGIIAGQSIGEPSTQMTLNTFHLAGHGGANVTLGIPRLNEILMLGSPRSKTPTMEFGFHGDPFDEKKAKKFADLLTCVYLKSAIRKIKCHETIGSNKRRVKIYIELVNAESSFLRRADEKPSVQQKEFKNKIKNEFIPKVERALYRALGSSEVNCFNVINSEVKPEVFSAVEKEFDDFGLNSDKDPGNSEDPSKEYLKKDRYSDRDKKDRYCGALSNDESDFQSGGRKKRDCDKGEPNVSEREEERGHKNNENKKNVNSDIERGKKDKKESNIRVKMKKNTVSIFLKIDSSNKKRIAVTKIVEKEAEKFKLRSTSNIERCYVVKRKLGKEKFTTRVQADGINFDALKQYHDDIDINCATCNDVPSTLKYFGVEACRKVIVEQTNAVFEAYGIRVNQRHLSLIADAMTWEGKYHAFNRRSMFEQNEPLLSMSFEAATTVLQRNLLDGKVDSMDTSTARLMFGASSKVGTGSFDVLQVLGEVRDQGE